MSRCLISFGANLGNPLETIEKAAQQIQALLGGRIQSFRMSRYFRTPAVGGPGGQPPFINSVAALELNECTAWEVWHVVREVEHTLGRVRQERWEARRIDLDVLLFDDQRIWTPHFKLPHPRMVMRRFILEPALDVAASWIEPVCGWSIQQLAHQLRGSSGSIVLVAGDDVPAQSLMEDAAEESKAHWITPKVSAHDPRESLTDAENTTTPGRWIGLVSSGKLQSQARLTPRPKLVFVLTGRQLIDGTRPREGAWEDVHRQLARQLGLCDGPSQWPFDGPRYLLSTDDLSWARHEIVAALDAMDCPIESC